MQMSLHGTIILTVQIHESLIQFSITYTVIINVRITNYSSNNFTDTNSRKINDPLQFLTILLPPIEEDRTNIDYLVLYVYYFPWSVSRYGALDLGRVYCNFADGRSDDRTIHRVIYVFKTNFKNSPEELFKYNYVSLFTHWCETREM